MSTPDKSLIKEIQEQSNNIKNLIISKLEHSNKLNCNYEYYNNKLLPLLTNFKGEFKDIVNNFDKNANDFTTNELNLIKLVLEQVGALLSLALNNISENNLEFDFGSRMIDFQALIPTLNKNNAKILSTLDNEITKYKEKINEITKYKEKIKDIDDYKATSAVALSCGVALCAIGLFAGLTGIGLAPALALAVPGIIMTAISAVTLLFTSHKHKQLKTQEAVDTGNKLSPLNNRLKFFNKMNEALNNSENILTDFNDEENKSRQYLSAN